MNKGLKLLLSAGLGAAAMYYFDSAHGRYRRAVARDGLARASRQAQHELDAARRDARNRARGLAARLRSVFDVQSPDDTVLMARVRACLGRVVSHPGSIHVQANDGVVELTGLILRDEVPLLMSCVRRVPGVADVHNALEVHAEPGRVPGLQGNPPRRTGQHSELMQARWSPAVRVTAALAGAVMALRGLGRHGAARTLTAQAGPLLVARAVTNVQIRRLFGIGEPAHWVEVHKHLRIQAPVEKVFELWNDFDNLPSLMIHVLRVRRLDTDRWHWTVGGPRGLPMEFDVRVTEHEPNRLLAWHSEPGAFMEHAGRVQFLDNGDGSTSVLVTMAYTPVGGILGHALAWLAGADPKHHMDQDLLRVKTFLETGKRPHDAAVPITRLADKRALP